jgi:hypothetical protein
MEIQESYYPKESHKTTQLVLNKKPVSEINTYKCVLQNVK